MFAYGGDEIQLRAEMTTPNFTYGSYVVTRSLLLFALAFSLIPILAATLGPWAALWALPFVGVRAYKLTMIMHDCAHGTLFAEPRINRNVGVFFGLLAGINFNAYGRLHFLHHTHFGEEEDPRGRDYLKYWSFSPRARLWHLLRPLFGFNLTHYRNVMRVVEMLPIRQQGIFFAAGFAVQGALATIATLGWRYPLLALIYPLSAATIGLFLSQLRVVAEHLPPKGAGDAPFVISHEPNWIDAALLYDLNFNYHREHHTYPEVPSVCLPALSLEISKRNFSQKPAYCMVHTLVQSVLK